MVFSIVWVEGTSTILPSTYPCPQYPPFKNNFQDGQGTETQLNGAKYIGKWKDGGRWYGIQTFPNGAKYVGEFKENEPWNVKEYDKNGNNTGKFVNGKIIKK